MRTSLEQFRALSSIDRGADGDMLRLWLEQNLQEIFIQLVNEQDSVAMRNLQGRARNMLEIQKDLTGAIDIVRKAHK